MPTVGLSAGYTGRREAVDAWFSDIFELQLPCQTSAILRRSLARLDGRGDVDIEAALRVAGSPGVRENTEIAVVALAPIMSGDLADQLDELLLYIPAAIGLAGTWTMDLPRPCNRFWEVATIMYLGWRAGVFSSVTLGGEYMPSFGRGTELATRTADMNRKYLIRSTPSWGIELPMAKEKTWGMNMVGHGSACSTAPSAEQLEALVKW